jgi:hypothetical protein
MSAVARAAQAVRDVLAAIDAGEVKGPGPLRNYLVTIVVTLDTLAAQQAQDDAQ